MPLIYGTAWKKERTVELVLSAWQAGFRAFDTACQPKHYREDLVGEALGQIQHAGVARKDFYLQTKFTPPTGQDAASIPYNRTLPVAEQVVQSFAVSLQNLRTDYVDGLILHSPLNSLAETLNVWRALECIYDSGAALRIGISNCYDLDFFKQLYAQATVKPSIVQNRFYAKTAFDKNLRAFCLQEDVTYQSFWTLTANPHILEQPIIILLCRRLRKTPAQIFFRYLVARGITPLTGTSDSEHMLEDLAISEFELGAADLTAIDGLLVP